MVQEPAFSRHAVAMSNYNNVKWHESYQKWYRQDFINGQWNTVWLDSDDPQDVQTSPGPSQGHARNDSLQWSPTTQFATQATSSSSHTTASAIASTSPTRTTAPYAQPTNTYKQPHNAYSANQAPLQSPHHASPGYQFSNTTWPQQPQANQQNLAYRAVTQNAPISPQYAMQSQPAHAGFSNDSFAARPLHPTDFAPRPPAPRQGRTVRGTYVPGSQAAAESHFEEFDPAFYVRSRAFFHEGKVFAVLFTEPAGTTCQITDYNTSISEVRFRGQYVYTSVRRFVVVRQRREFCYACPIFTYSNRATTKSGVRPEEHAIAYSYGQNPILVENEAPLAKTPMPVVMTDNEPLLHRASRIYFGIHHPIQYNVKVKDLGYVHPQYVPTLLGYWNAENQTTTNQSVEVTANANYEDEDEEEIPSSSY